MSCYKGVGRKNKRNPKASLIKQNDIPHAPAGRRLAAIAERDLPAWREALDEEYPIMSPEEISRAEQPFHMLILHDMITAGDSDAAQEIHAIFRKEDRERAKGRLTSKRSIRDQHLKLEHLAKNLRMYYDHVAHGEYEHAIDLKKELGEAALHEGTNWLAKHFFYSSLSACRTLRDALGEDHHADPYLPMRLQKTEAELHCLLAFLSRETGDTLETSLAVAIDHLALCRTLTKGQRWQFKPKILTIKLKKPIAIHGLRFDESEIYDVVDGCSMTIYMISTLLEHELLISLANQMMHTHHRAPTDEDVKAAHEFADHALKLALEVRQPTAMSSALVRFGLVLRHSGAYEDALTYFEKLKHNAIVTGDYLTEAIAYHNIGLCLIGSHKSSEALECFAKQLDLAGDFKVKDLEADAMYEIGHVFLQEGHIWEAEECYTICFEDFKTMAHTNSHSLAAWSMLGVAAGHKLWGRFANLCRHNRNSDYWTLLNWKCSRGTLTSNHRPNYKPLQIGRSYAPYVKKMLPPSMQKVETVNYEDLADILELSSDTYSESKEREKRAQMRNKRIKGINEPTTSSTPEPAESTIPVARGPGDDTELDVSQLDTDYIQDSEELPGYERFNKKRVSSSDPEMFLQEMKRESVKSPPKDHHDHEGEEGEGEMGDDEHDDDSSHHDDSSSEHHSSSGYHDSDSEPDQDSVDSFDDDQHQHHVHQHHHEHVEHHHDEEGHHHHHHEDKHHHKKDSSDKKKDSSDKKKDSSDKSKSLSLSDSPDSGGTTVELKRRSAQKQVEHENDDDHDHDHSHDHDHDHDYDDQTPENSHSHSTGPSTGTEVTESTPKDGEKEASK